MKDIGLGRGVARPVVFLLSKHLGGHRDQAEGAAGRYGRRGLLPGRLVAEVGGLTLTTATTKRLKQVGTCRSLRAVKSTNQRLNLGLWILQRLNPLR